MTRGRDDIEVLVVTGMSGAGRSSAARVLEDLGWFVVDNLPTALIRTIVELAAKPTSDIERLALVAGRQHAEVLTKVGESPYKHSFTSMSLKPRPIV
jgi:UPF0042 nucleotide-binding protein